MVTTDDMLTAYYDCRRKKRRTASAVVYEMDYESRLIALRDRINARTYRPAKSICFVVTRPRYREVFAASFEDRIVHHYIALRLEPLFEEVFSPRTFNCRKGKGQLYGIRMLRIDIFEESEGYTADCYIIKLDLKGFFMSINKAQLADMIDRFILERYRGEDLEDLRFLCRVVVMHEPEKNCERHSPASLWSCLPANKSLFTNGPGKGIAIGNLFSQLFANFLLNSLDWKLEEMGIKRHGRYVDDFYCVSKDKAQLLAAIPEIRDFLAGYGLQLNEKKFYLQHYSKGIGFTGVIVKPGRTYINNRTLANFTASVLRLNVSADLEQIRRCISSVNSYLGLMRQCDEYGKRVKVLKMISPRIWRYIYVKGRWEAVRLKSVYRPRAENLRKIRDGDW